MKDEDSSVLRACAAWALGEVGDEEETEPLITALKNDKNRHVRACAAKALKKLTNQDFGTDYEKWKAWYEKNKDK